MATQSNAITDGATNDYGGKGFDIRWDIEELKPEAYAGKYEFRFGKATWNWTKKHPARPMICLEIKIIDTYEESAECKGSVDVELTDYIVLDDSSSQASNRAKAKLRLLRDKLELSTDFSRMTPETIDAFAEEIFGREMTGWVTNYTEAETRNVRSFVEYSEPRGRATTAPAPRRNDTDEGSDDEEPEPIAARNKAKPKSAIRR